MSVESCLGDLEAHEDSWRQWRRNVWYKVFSNPSNVEMKSLILGVIGNLIGDDKNA